MYLVDKYRNLDDYADHVFDLCHPIGEIYIRYPGQSSPQDLYERGTWENISDQFAGLFFRAEGGNAESFQETVDSDNPLVSQEDKIRKILGAFSFVSAVGEGITETGASIFTGAYIAHQGGFAYGSAFTSGWGTVGFGIDANRGDSSNNPMAGHADGPEIRPVNTTIQIWKRTA